MITPVYSNRKIAKIRFFAAYAVSVLLFVVLFSSFLAPDNDASEKKIAAAIQTTDRHAAICQLLHKRMEKLDHISAEVAKNKSAVYMSLLQQEEAAFYTGVDSIRKTVASLSDENKEREYTTLLESFSRAAERQVGLVKGILLSGETTGSSRANKDQLLQKDQRIQELESENRLLMSEKELAVSALQNRPAAPAPAPQRANDAGASLWKERYESLKTTVDKLKENNERYSAQTEELKKSYRDVVEDNRRLLAQLQAARAGRN